MWEDPIVAEVHRTREKMATESNFDISKYFVGLRNRQAAQGDKLVRQEKSRQPSYSQSGSISQVSGGSMLPDTAPVTKL
jgi:hypothetical protein